MIILINTVLGLVKQEDLGVTLFHEHIVVNLINADDQERTYSTFRSLLQGDLLLPSSIF